MYKTFPFFLILFLFTVPSGWAEVATVTVRGEAELEVPADQVNFRVAIVSEHETPEMALAQNSNLTEKVVQALLRSGLPEKDVSTGQFVINPRWSRRPQQSVKDWKPEIVGYTVKNSLKIKTQKVDKVGEFIATSVKAGSNEVNSLYFDLADPRQYRHEAIRIATERAQKDARVLAVASDHSLGRVISLNLDDARSEPVRVMAERAFLAQDNMTPPIAPGEVTVKANVTAVYELK